MELVLISDIVLLTRTNELRERLSNLQDELRQVDIDMEENQGNRIVSTVKPHNKDHLEKCKHSLKTLLLILVVYIPSSTDQSYVCYKQPVSSEYLLFGANLSTLTGGSYWECLITVCVCE